jgi:hypothetical protein
VPEYFSLFASENIKDYHGPHTRASAKPTSRHYRPAPASLAAGVLDAFAHPIIIHVVMHELQDGARL